MNKTGVIIIGAGPAGITAAVQLKRMSVNFVLIEKNIPGGLIRNANYIENYPGFPTGITGEKFAGLLRNQLLMHEIDVVQDCVLSADFEDVEFIIRTQNQEYRSAYLLIASGTFPVQPENINISDECRGRIFSDISDFYDCFPNTSDTLKIAIIGSGDAAFDYALNAGKKYLKPTIFMRSKSAKAITLLQNRVIHQRDRLLRPDEKEYERDYTSFYPHSLYRSSIFLEREHELLSVRMEDNKFSEFPRLILSFRHKGEIREYYSHFLLFAIGRHPNLDFLSPSFIPNITELEKNKRLFFAGDVKNKNDRQLSIAVGDAMKAAMTIYHEIYRDR